MTEKKSSEKCLYHTSSSDKAEHARKLLFRLKPRPCVYVYIKSDGFDVCVSNEWGALASEEYYLKAKQIIAEGMATYEAEEAAKIA